MNKPLWFAATLLATSNALGNVEAEIELGIEVRAETGVEVQFMPVLASHRFSVETYQSIWSRYGARIIASLERRTCLPFIEPRVGALVDDATSHSGGRDHPMRLRATYADETKMSTLVHELGHRHLWQLEERLENVDGHQTLYLILDRVWADVWGEEFALERVAAESQWRSDYDYAQAWTWAQSLSLSERTRMWDQLLTMNGFDAPCEGLLETHSQLAHSSYTDSSP